MSRAYLGLGSNSDDRAIMLKRARILINIHLGVVTSLSRLYDTQPWGYHAQANFTNQVIEIRTTLEPKTLHSRLLKIEAHLGKHKTSKYGPRNIDVDILLFEDQIINEADLKIPHPRMHERNFVLIPLTEIAPAMVHPILGRTIEDLKSRCGDTGVVRIQE